MQFFNLCIQHEIVRWFDRRVCPTNLSFKVRNRKSTIDSCKNPRRERNIQVSEISNIGIKKYRSTFCKEWKYGLQKYLKWSKRIYACWNQRVQTKSEKDLFLTLINKIAKSIKICKLELVLKRMTVFDSYLSIEILLFSKGFIQFFFWI